MATRVVTQYGKGQQAISVTTRDGKAAKVTLWTPGKRDSTERHEVLASRKA